MLPAPGSQQPAIAGFAEAQDRKRALMGSDIVFLWPAQVTFGAEVPVSPETGLPYDPTASAVASAQASASVRASAFFKAVNRGGAQNADSATAIGREEISRVFLNVAAVDAAKIQGASQFIFHGNRFQIYVTKWDEIVLGYKRYLVYGAGEGSALGDGTQ